MNWADEKWLFIARLATMAMLQRLMEMRDDQ
jgi:hypothetical protein